MYKIIKDVEKLGYKALVITIDRPYHGFFFFILKKII